ncbi:hypothetical protein BS47DRAFT_1386191 [Hydnum rufescens UP504]|uniref:Uncharacterized protein n=1 Tax=Hydnum rufescens UP504 TaxID=1448309 RepID=A0A9P6DN26_9AGAM|nr:hypothetical protein BS47DRAFT_1386191 [Hydnum rufescens UP504]
MVFFSKLLSFLKMSDPSPPRDSIPPFLLPGNLAKRPLGVWYTQLVNLTHDESPPYTAFKLATIFHWERFEKFKHEGLTLVFERDPRFVVYLRIDRMSFENDPWHASKGSSASLVPKSFGGSPQAAKDQEGVEREGRAADWCQPLDVGSRPNVVDVILAVLTRGFDAGAPGAGKGDFCDSGRGPRGPVWDLDWPQNFNIFGLVVDQLLIYLQN